VTGHPARAGLVTLTAAFLLAACGGDEDEPTSTVTVTEAAEDASAADEPAAKPRPKPLSPTEEAQQTVAEYYEAVDGQRFGRAWDLLAAPLQGELGGFAAWRAGYDNTIKTNLIGVEATAADSETASAAIELVATDLDACGDTVKQTFAGTWTLTRSEGRWLGSAFDVAKTGGATPVADASACGGGGAAPVPLAGSGCDPNYTGCVPLYPPDVDCIDVGQEVDVIGEDVHQLDLGGDGEACEVFLR
jgi:hypothetical protein